jgi:hypothetical protein
MITNDYGTLHRYIHIQMCDSSYLQVGFARAVRTYKARTRLSKLISAQNEALRVLPRPSQLRCSSLHTILTLYTTSSRTDQWYKEKIFDKSQFGEKSANQ